MIETNGQLHKYMSYELVVLSKEWLFTPIPHQFDALVGIINKAYSKPMAKFGIIVSPRVKTPLLFLNDFLLSPSKDIFVALLLGSQETFDNISADCGYKRKFNPQVRPLSNSMDSDIPAEYVSYFGEFSANTVKVSFPSPGTPLDENLADRILATVGFKSISNTDSPHAKNSRSRDYELTAYTSFMKRMGPLLLEYCLSNFVCSPNCQFADHTHVDNCTIHAVVIKEHNLVPYYTAACKFEAYEKEDELVSASGESSNLEEGVTATRDFHLSFLRRHVGVKA